MSTLLQPRRWGRRPIRAPRRGPAAQLASPTRRSAEGLRFTEWLFVGVLALATLFAVSTPLFGVKLQLSAVSHAPLFLMGFALVLHLAGLALNRNATPWESVASMTWPLVALAAFALAGSAVAKWQFAVDDSYLTFGIYTMLVPLFVAVVPQDAARARRWAVVLVAVWVAFSAASLLGEAVRIGSAEALHEIEYLVLGGFFALFHAVEKRRWKLLALLCLLAAAVLNRKLTGYIIAAMALMHIALAAGWRGLLPRWRGTYVWTAGIGSVLFIALAVGLYFTFRDYLPSGNTEVRLKQYEASLQGFFESPLWGSAYTRGSGEAYTEYRRVLNIPTHSDVIDILKHGGLIGLALFAWGYWKLFITIHRGVGATQADPLLSGYLTAMRFFAVTALVTFSLNPLLLRGPYLIVIWGNLGLAAGIAWAVTVRPARKRPW